jgi:hypothetical protein
MLLLTNAWHGWDLLCPVHFMQLSDVVGEAEPYLRQVGQQGEAPAFRGAHYRNSGLPMVEVKNPAMLRPVSRCSF